MLAITCCAAFGGRPGAKRNTRATGRDMLQKKLMGGLQSTVVRSDTRVIGRSVSVIRDDIHQNSLCAVMGVVSYK